MDFKVDYKIGGRMIMNLRHADDIILLATSEAELQELVDRPDRVSRRYSLLINVDKTKVCLLYTSPSPRDGLLSRMPSSA